MKRIFYHGHVYQMTLEYRCLYNSASRCKGYIFIDPVIWSHRYVETMKYVTYFQNAFKNIRRRVNFKKNRIKEKLINRKHYDK